ncbi:MAG: CHAT domain-containing protein [Anaerolineae bacterium]
MTDYAELEMTLTRWEADHYRVDLRFTQPNSDADIRPAAGAPLLAHLDRAQLQSRSLAPDAYGKLLAAGLFEDTRLLAAFASARATARSNDWPLRLRLFIDPSAAELHALRWEMLCDPQDGTALATSERLLLSRYLSSQDWRPVKLRPMSDLRALVCIANPSDLTELYDLAPVDVAGELSRTQTALRGVPVTSLASGGAATLDNLVTRLRDGYDLLYLVCHGGLVEGDPRLWLEAPDGKTAVVRGADLVTRLNELTAPPRLIVLASCASAKMFPDAGDALVTLGPRLAESGVAAVLAMQGNITMETVAGFMPVLFQELLRDGQIDRAVAAARGAVRARPDSWMPALFMRLKSGRIGYVPGFAGDDKGFEKWTALFEAIRGDPEDQEGGSRCIPVLGDGLNEPFYGSRREIAAGWAKQYRFPLAGDHEALPAVAQFLAVNQDVNTLRKQFSQYLRDRIWERFGDALPPEAKTAPMPQLMAQAAAQWRQRDPSAAHQVLAALPLDIYITTTPDNLLVEALKAAGKDPQVELCRWNDKIKTKSIYAQNPGYRPTPQQPLVYCFFGQLNDPNSLVLTEDDYFDFLIGAMRNRELIPPVVRSALANRLLLLLGFQMDDWTFRVPFRYITSQEGGDLRESFTHIAAQIDPDESRAVAPERAHDYLDKYFQDARFHKDVSISIYWGSVQDFARELDRQWRKS